jgi:hypothetical protein
MNEPMSQEGRYRLDLIQTIDGTPHTILIVASANRHRVIDLGESLAATGPSLQKWERFQVVDTHARVVLWESTDATQAEIQRLAPLDARD